MLVLENRMKFHEVGVTNKDAKFLDLRKFQITDIARLFRAPLPYRIEKYVDLCAVPQQNKTNHQSKAGARWPPLQKA